MKQYKSWFFSEINKLKIDLNDIEKVIIKIAYEVKIEYKPMNKQVRYYTCNTTITAKGKDYTKKVVASYS